MRRRGARGGRGGGRAVRGRRAGWAGGGGLPLGGRLDRPRLGRLPLHGTYRALGGACGRRLRAGRRARPARSGSGQRGRRTPRRGALPRSPQRPVLGLDPLCLGRRRRFGWARPRHGAHGARAGDRPVPAALRDVARFHGPEEQAADGGRARRCRRSGGSACRRGRDRRARRDRAPARRPRQPLLRAPTGDARWSRQHLADRHARLQAFAGLCLPAVGGRGGPGGGSRRRRDRRRRDRGRLAHLRDGGARRRSRPHAGAGQLLGDAHHGNRPARRPAHPGRAGADLARASTRRRSAGWPPVSAYVHDPALDRQDAARLARGRCLAGPWPRRSTAYPPPPRRHRHGRGESGAGGAAGAARRPQVAPCSGRFAARSAARSRGRRPGFEASWRHDRRSRHRSAAR